MTASSLSKLFSDLLHSFIMYSPPNYYTGRPSKKGSTTMPPGVPHPEAGMPLGPDTERCKCGGKIGICGTPGGASKWRSHMRTQKHMDWDPIFNN